MQGADVEEWSCMQPGKTEKLLCVQQVSDTNQDNSDTLGLI